MKIDTTISASVTREAWDAVFKGDVGALDKALSSGANIESIHPFANHSLLSQAVKSQVKASEMSTILIDRGAQAPSTKEPLAFELTWCAIMEDNPLLAKKLMDQNEPWKEFFTQECAKFVTSEPTKINTYFKAICAFEAIDRFNQMIASQDQGSQASAASSAHRPGR